MDFSQRILVVIVFAISIVNHSYAQNIEIKTFYDDNNTSIKEIYFIEDSISAQLSGPYKSFYQNGVLEKKGFFKDNYPDSLWTYYYESGEKKMSGMIRKGINHGFWEYYYENGNLSMAGKIVNSKREGIWKFYYESGNLKSQGFINKGKKEGIWNYFYEEGELKAQVYYKNDRGRYKEFYIDGKLKAEGLNINGKSDSIWVFYHENEKIKAMGKYDKGKRVGPWVFYHDNELVSTRGNYTDGQKEGQWIYFHRNGEKSSEGALREGKKEGYWKIFGEDGKFKAEGVFKQDNGSYTEYYESGKIKAEGQILDGMRDGLWKYYYEDGTKEGECTYTSGNGEYTGYYKNGNPKMKGKINNGVNVGIWELYKEDGSLAGYYRPYYEDNKPIYKLVEKKKTQRGNYIKPEYKFKSYKSRYFDPVINEYKGIIISTNPLATIFNQLPISFEYYIEERLGYEIMGTLLRDPFYTSSENLPLNEVYSRGFNIALKQKFYHPEGSFGMFYFGHEVSLTSLKHFANVIDSTSMNLNKIKIDTKETKFEYAFFIGDRWMRLFGDRYRNNSLGFTIDAFIGFGFGYRLYEKKYPNNPVYDEIFEDVNDSKFVISPRVGLNFGFIF